METLPSPQLADPIISGDQSTVIKQLLSCIKDLQTQVGQLQGQITKQQQKMALLP